jgi:hypothetical protein
MIRVMLAVGFVLASAQAFAQLTVPKGYSVGDIMVIDPLLCGVTEFDLPEPLPFICKTYIELGQSRGFLTDYGPWCVNSMEGKTEEIIRQACERNTEE